MSKNIDKNYVLSWGGYFFILILIIYVLVFAFAPNTALSALINFLITLKKLALILILVMVFMFMVNLLATPKLIQRFLGQKAGVRGPVAAIISGILISGPPYVLYPMLGGLKKQGMSYELIAIFLFNRNVKIPFLLASVFYFGMIYTLVLSVYIIIFSIINGKIMGRIMRAKNLSTI
jgi:uncharacterized membrane protein YraQ (UPF0718 family)